MRWSGLVGSVLWLWAASCTSSLEESVNGGPDGDTDQGTDARPDSAPDDGTDGGADVVPDATPIVETVHIDGELVEINGGPPIAGAQICIVDRPDLPCFTSRADGKYTVTLPAWMNEVDIIYNVTAAGHLGCTGIIHEIPGTVGWVSYPIYDDAAAADLMSHAGFPSPAPGKALVMLEVLGPGGIATGVTVSASSAGAGPVYGYPLTAPDPSLTSVPAQGYALFGNLEPGPIEITVSAACKGIVYAQGWPGTKPNSIAGWTVADSITHMTVDCQ